jgi:hypothetical protein
MAHTLSSEGGNDVKSNANVHSSIFKQVMLVMALTVIIKVLAARLQWALAVTGPGEFSRGREAGQSAGNNAAMSGMPFDAQVPSEHNFDWMAGYYVGYSEGYNTAKNVPRTI